MLFRSESEEAFDTVEKPMEEEFFIPEDEVTVTIQIKTDPFNAAFIKKLLDNNNIQYEVVE